MSAAAQRLAINTFTASNLLFLAEICRNENPGVLVEDANVWADESEEDKEIMLHIKSDTGAFCPPRL